jgi:hypothetical protein
MLSVARGRLTGRELRSYRTADGGTRAGVRNPVLLLDLRRVTRFDTGTLDIRARADTPRHMPPRFARIAVLVGDDLGFGLARMYQAFAGDRYPADRFQVFKDRSEAVRWLLGE